MKSVYTAVRTGSLNKAVCASSVKGYYFENIGLLKRTHLAADMCEWCFWWN